MYNQLPKQFLINDKRKYKDFKKVTFNGYKKTAVFSDFQKSILSGNIEKSILWSTELHCSGYIKNIYTRLFDIYIKEINKANLKLLPIFLKELNKLDKISEVFKDNILNVRNEQYIRNHITDLVCLLTFSPKYKLAKLPKMESSDFNMKNNKPRMISKNLNAIQIYLKEDDPRDLIIPLSEILLNLKCPNLSKSFENCLFWLNWILIYEKNFHNSYIKCHTRRLPNISEKSFNDFSWILWEILIDLSSKEDIYIKILFELYKRNFKKSNKRKKMNLVIIAFTIIIDPFPKINYDDEIISEKNMKKKNKIIANINYQYLDLVFNVSDNIVKKRLNNPPRKIETAKVSPFFSKEIFGKTDIEKVVEKFTDKNLVKINKKKKIKPKKIFKPLIQTNFDLKKTLNVPPTVKFNKDNKFSVKKVFTKINNFYDKK